MINLHERMLPTSAGVEPATSWSPVGRRIQLSHRGRQKKKQKKKTKKKTSENSRDETVPKVARVTPPPPPPKKNKKKKKKKKQKKKKTQKKKTKKKKTKKKHYTGSVTSDKMINAGYSLWYRN